MNKILEMKKIKTIIIAVLFLIPGLLSVGQEVKQLTFEEVIKLSEEQSPNALIAMHRFRSSYWQYRSYKAQFLPSLSMRGTAPNYSQGFDRVYNSQLDEYIFTPKNTIQSSTNLSLSQAVGITGTTIALESRFIHNFDFEKDRRIYTTTPVNLVITQPIKQYSSLRWQRKTEPLKYEMAKKTFLASIESVHQQAVQNFFSLAQAQINKQIAVMNLSNADTLYRIAAGRYQLGTIAEDDLLQMQLSYLNAETAGKEADMNLRDREIRLRSFLGYNENVRLELIIPNEIPSLQIDMQEVLDLALQNNPDIMNQQLTILNAQSSLAQAKAAKGLNASLSASMGLTTSGNDLMYSIENPSQSQAVSIQFNVPILDWGKGKGNYRMARSSLELAQVQVAQSMADFKQNLSLDVEQFNMQRNQVGIAAKSDTVAMRMYEVTKQRFLIGKIAILDLNNADTKKDQNKRAYVQALQNYWNYFYNIRGLALYDFINKRPLETDYENLLE